jgi:hypothetical protein
MTYPLAESPGNELIGQFGICGYAAPADLGWP